MPARFALPVLLAIALASGGAPARAASTVTVNFIEPDRFADIGIGTVARQRNLDALKRHFISLGRHLPDGQVLTIDVLEVDLAGEVQPWRRDPDLRVLKGGADWPRMMLRWTLEAGGQTLRRGEDRLADMGYLSHLAGPPAGEPLTYDRRMIDEWFRDRVLVPAR